MAAMGPGAGEPESGDGGDEPCDRDCMAACFHQVFIREKFNKPNNDYRLILIILTCSKQQMLA